MSLQVWLPLTGHLNNQGLGNVTVTNNSATVDNNGKIGKCYSFNGSNQYLNNTNFEFDTSTDYSTAFWVYFTALPTGTNARPIAICKNASSAYADTVFSISIDYINNGSQGKFAIIDGGAVVYYDYSFATGIWYHIALTKQGNTKKLYMNGQLLTTFSFGGSTRSYKYLFIGGVPTNSRILNGKLNDVRIYDHALSAKEVKELSKGLVLHYPLSNNGCGELITDDTIEYDTSGYNYHGTRGGIFSYNTDSIRYNVCSEFSGSQYVIIGKQLYGIRDAVTVNIWAYKDNWDTKCGTFFSGIQSGGYGWQVNSTNFKCYCGTGATSNTYLQVALTTNTLSSGWHMFSFTYDGKVLRTYIDAIAKGTYTGSVQAPIFFADSSGMFVGAEAGTSATVPNSDYFTGKISDCRIYGTALSADDIKELYNTAASLANNGTLFAYDFVEA